MLLSLLLFTVVLRAEPLLEPCGGVLCNEKMSAIAEEYKAAGALDLSVPHLSSGDCHHANWNFDGEVTHFGYALLDFLGEQVFMGGEFGFFQKENPYTSLTLAEARLANPRLFEKNHRAEVAADHLYVDMNPGVPENPWRYWLRQKGETVLLIGQWGLDHRLFCRFQKHRQTSRRRHP